jgi:hypothetical protein
MKKAPSIDRRKYPRVRTDAVMAIRRLDESSKLAHGVDLGLGGIRFFCVGLELELGDLIEVTFTIGRDTATVVGRAIRTIDLDAFTQEVALAFVDLVPATLEKFYELGLGEED